MSCRASVTVTADRRRVVLRITEQVTELAGVRKETVIDRKTLKEVTVESPDLAESSTATTVQADDGELVLLPVRYLPPAAREKGRVLVMLVRPLIYIEEEERERKKGQ